MRNDEPGEPSLDMEQEVAMMIKRRFSFKKQHLNLSNCPVLQTCVSTIGNKSSSVETLLQSTSSPLVLSAAFRR